MPVSIICSFLMELKEDCHTLTVGQTEIERINS
jgi:hypothetical protein